MPVDSSADVTVLALSEAHALIVAIRQLDTYSGIWYSFYPEGEQMQCHVGSEAWINLRLQNDGNGAGLIFLKITRLDTNVVIRQMDVSLSPGSYVDIDNISFIMPANDLSLRIEIGHYA